MGSPGCQSRNELASTRAGNLRSAQVGSAKDALAAFLAHEQVQDLLGRLTDREKEVLTFRYGLKDGVTYTLGETAKFLGITRERVRQIQNSAEKKLHTFLATQEKENSAQQPAS